MSPCASSDSRVVTAHNRGVVRKHGVLADDVLAVAQHGVRERQAGPPRPLEVPEPQDQIRDDLGARVHLQPQELFGHDPHASHFHGNLGVPQVGQLTDHFGLQGLQQVEGDVKEVPGSAGGVQDPQVAQPALEVAQQLAGGLALGLSGRAFLRVHELPYGRLHGVPFGPQRINHGRADQAFDVLARREVGAQLVALAFVQGLFQQRERVDLEEWARTSSGLLPAINAILSLPSECRIPGVAELLDPQRQRVLNLVRLAVEALREKASEHGIPSDACHAMLDPVIEVDDADESGLARLTMAALDSVHMKLAGRVVSVLEQGPMAAATLRSLLEGSAGVEVAAEVISTIIKRA